MIRFLRFSPSRLALGYIVLSVLALALFAIPLWYAWRINLSTFKAYVQGEDLQRLVDVFDREGANGLTAAMVSQATSLPADEIMILADPSKLRLAGNLPAWPAQVPDAPGTYGLVIDIGGGATMRVVGSHVVLPGGYHLLVGRESVLFHAFIERFWFGIAGAMAIVLVLSAAIGWLIRRGLLSEVQEISRTASAIVQGDLSRRLATRGGSDALATLAQTVNGMLEQLARQNVRLEGEIAVRRQAEQALHLAHGDLEGLVAQRTAQLARVNESMEGEKRLLEMIAKGNPLPATLDALCRHVEEISSGILCSILLLDSNGGRMRYGAAPSLPDSYVAATQGWPLTAGPCGMAATLGEPVIASDIASDERWVEYKALASAHGLKACWSTPIIASDRRVLGTFAMLSREPGSPTPQHRDTIEQVTHIASIAIERTRAEEELRRQKAHRDELFDLAPDAIVLTSLSPPRILRVNREFTRMFGYAPEEAGGQRLRNLIAPDDLKPANLTESPDLLAERTVEREVIRQRKDGTRFHAHITAKRIRLGNSEDAAYIIYRDITEHKGAEEALRVSEERYARSMDATEAGHWEWDLRTNEVFHSARFRELHGVPAEERFTHRDQWKARQQYLPGEREQQEQAIRAAISGPTNRYEIDLRIAPRPGEIRWLRSRGKLFRDEAGRPALMAGTSMDVTDQKLAQEALRLSEERYAGAMEVTREGYWDWDVATDDMFVSGRMKQILGFAPDEGYSKCSEFDAHIPYHPEDRERVKEMVDAALAGTLSSLDLEYRIILPPGNVRWLQLRWMIFRDDKGTPVRVIGVMADSTERRAAEEEVRRLERQLRQSQRLEAMGTLAGGIAHDFNNILGAILGYGEMALRDAPKGSRLRRDLESITVAGERGRALVDRILAFSRSGVGERVAVDVEKVVRESLDLLIANLPAGITVKAELRAGRAAMRGDPTQVHQVVMNLATNGIQAMDPGGMLRVSLGTVRLDAQRIAATGTVAAGSYILLKVADTGRGIPAGILDRIFDPFFTTKDVGVGTGLGLSLVHGIVTEVGGAIDIETTLGAGSTFTVYLPRAGDAADGSEDEQPDLPRGDQQRVLVVDDEEPLVTLTTRTLEELGYTPVGFTSSAAALEAFRADPKRFDAVITDERMPGISGSALIREMRGIRRSIPILLVSGYVGGMVVGRAYNAGANEVLKKPLSAHELATSLARVLHLQ